MNLPQTSLHPRLASRITSSCSLLFKPYSYSQLGQILKQRLENCGNDLFHPKAIEFTSRKVSMISGDLRLGLRICNQAVLLSFEEWKRERLNEKEEEEEEEEKQIEEDNQDIESEDPQTSITIDYLIKQKHIRQALKIYTSSPIRQYLEHNLNICSFLILRGYYVHNHYTAQRKLLVHILYDRYCDELDGFVSAIQNHSAQLTQSQEDSIKRYKSELEASKSQLVDWMNFCQTLYQLESCGILSRTTLLNQTAMKPQSNSSSTTSLGMVVNQIIEIHVQESEFTAATAKYKF